MIYLELVPVFHTRAKKIESAGLYVVRLYNYINPVHFLRGENLKQNLFFTINFVSINLRKMLELNSILKSKSEFLSFMVVIYISILSFVLRIIIFEIKIKEIFLNPPHIAY